MCPSAAVGSFDDAAGAHKPKPANPDEAADFNGWYSLFGVVVISDFRP